MNAQKNKGIMAHIKQNETFTLYGEYEINDNNMIIIYNNTYYTLRSLEGTKVTKEVIVPEENMEDYPIHKATENNEALIYADEGVSIRKGPAKSYDAIGTIKKGTKLKYTYYYNDACKEYLYIEYNDIKGWIETTNSKVLIEEPHNFIIEKDTNIGCATIPANTTINTKYANNGTHKNEVDYRVLIEYNNCQNLFQYMYYGNLSENITELDANGEKIVENNTIDTKPISKETKDPNYITTYIILCSVIVIMAIVIIILINKKKTKKETQ